MYLQICRWLKTLNEDSADRRYWQRRCVRLERQVARLMAERGQAEDGFESCEEDEN